jgi:hypothetical protein
VPLSETRQDSLKVLISKRIGVEKFLDKLGVIGRHEAYAKVLKSPQLRYQSALEPLLDHEFARLHKCYEGAIVNCLSGGDAGKGGADLLVLDSARNDAVVNELRAEIARLAEENRRIKEVSLLSAAFNPRRPLLVDLL